MKELKEVDPVEELHKIRRAIWKEAGGTPDAYAQYYMEMSKKRLAASKAAEETIPVNSNSVQSISRRKSAKPAVKAKG